MGWNIRLERMVDDATQYESARAFKDLVLEGGVRVTDTPGGDEETGQAA